MGAAMVKRPALAWYVQNLPIFKGLRKDEIESIDRVSRMIHLEQKSVFNLSLPDQAVCILKQGKLLLQELNASSDYVAIDILHPGDVFGFMTPLQRGALPFLGQSAMALEVSVVCVFDQGVFRRVLESMPVIQMHILDMAMQRTAQWRERLTEMMYFSARARLARFLLRYARIDSSIRLKSIFPWKGLRQSDIAMIIGLSRASTVELLHEFRGRGIIDFNRHELRILSRDLLERVIAEEVHEKTPLELSNGV
jgi:CRP-like cAMP-binding protein